jgi:hypothetical protein
MGSVLKAYFWNENDDDDTFLLFSMYNPRTFPWSLQELIDVCSGAQLSACFASVSFLTKQMKALEVCDEKMGGRGGLKGKRRNLVS